MPGLFPFDVQVSEGVLILKPLGFLELWKRLLSRRWHHILGRPIYPVVFVNHPVRCRSA